MAIKKTNITLDGLAYALDERDRVAAQLVNENDNTFSGANTHSGSSTFYGDVSFPPVAQHSYRHTSFKETGRYYLDEDFAKAPGVNGDVFNTD